MKRGEDDKDPLGHQKQAWAILRPLESPLPPDITALQESPSPWVPTNTYSHEHSGSHRGSFPENFSPPFGTEAFLSPERRLSARPEGMTWNLATGRVPGSQNALSPSLSTCPGVGEVKTSSPSRQTSLRRELKESHIRSGGASWPPRMRRRLSTTHPPRLLHFQLKMTEITLRWVGGRGWLNPA